MSSRPVVPTVNRDQSTPLTWYGVPVDIDDRQKVEEALQRKRAEEALRESEERFRDYVEIASDWFWETDRDHKITLLIENPFGSDPANRIGTIFWDHALDLETEAEKWR